MKKAIQIPRGAIVRKVNLEGLSPKQKSDAQDSELELELFNTIVLYAKPRGLPIPVRQFLFDKVRKWRLDMAFPDVKVLVEVQGGTYSPKRGAHSRGKGQSRDFEKLNAAVQQGWFPLQFDSKAIERKRIMLSIELIYATVAAIQIRRAAAKKATGG